MIYLLRMVIFHSYVGLPGVTSYLYQKIDCGMVWKYSFESCARRSKLRDWIPEAMRRCVRIPYISHRVAKLRRWEDLTYPRWEDLRWEDVRCEDVRCEDLRWEDVRCEDVKCEDVRWENLRWADVRCEDVRWEDLRWADVRCEDVRCEDLRWEDIRCEDVRWEDLRWEDVRCEDVRLADPFFWRTLHSDALGKKNKIR